MTGLNNIYQNNIVQGENFIEKAKKNGYYTEDEISLRQLVAAYLENKNYGKMLPIYQKLFKINSSQIQYKVSTMLCYKELGNYPMARQLAGEIIKSNPELKPQIENFLQSF
jgi:tetratricopeptide (TPR) repeat protein